MPLAVYVAGVYLARLWPAAAALSNNMLVQTIFGSTILGAVVGTGREVVFVGLKMLLGQLVTRAELSSHDSKELHRAVKFMLQTNKTSTSSEFSCTVRAHSSLKWHERTSEAAKYGLVKLTPTFSFMPATMTWKGHYIVLWTKHQASPKGGEADTDLVYVWMWGSQKHDALSAFLQHVVQQHADKLHKSRLGGTVVFEPNFRNGACCWSEILDISPRGRDSLVLGNNLMDSILTDAQVFFASRDKYVSKRQPHRRGYLFYGPPGTGKSSLARVLASEVVVNDTAGVPLYLLQLAEQELTDANISSLLMQVQTPCTVLIEDVDCVGVSHRRTPINVAMNGTPRKLTLSGLLNALDGAVAGEGRIVILTSNHQEMLDPALCRPGRIDRHFPLTFMSREQVVGLFLYHCKDDFDSLEAAQTAAEGFADMIPPRCITGAYLQMYFMECEEIGAAKIGTLTNRHNVMSFIMRTLQETNQMNGTHSVFGLEAVLYNMLWGYGYERMFPWMIRACKFQLSELSSMTHRKVLKTTPDLWYDRRMWAAAFMRRTVMPLTRESLGQVLSEHFPRHDTATATTIYERISAAPVPVYIERFRHFISMNQDSLEEVLKALPSELLNFAPGTQCHLPVMVSVPRFLSMACPHSHAYAPNLAELGISNLLHLRAAFVTPDEKKKSDEAVEAVPEVATQKSVVRIGTMKKLLPHYVYDELKEFFNEVETRERYYVQGAQNFVVRVLYRDELAKLLATSFPSLSSTEAWRFARELTDADGRSRLSQHNWAAALDAASTPEDCVRELKAFSAVE